MAYRFTKTEKWKDKWYVELPVTEKIVWQYLCDNCDNAGFFEPNPRIDSYTIGITKEQFEGAIKGLSRGLIFSHDNDKIFIKKFVIHQKNYPLNTANNAHKQIINIINLNIDKFNYNFEYLGANEGLISPIGKGKGKGIVEVEVKDAENNLQNSNLFRKPKVPLLNDVKLFFYHNGGTDEMADKFYNKWEGVGWYSNGSPIVNFAHFAKSFIENYKKLQKQNYEKPNNRIPADNPNIADYQL